MGLEEKQLLDFFPELQNYSYELTSRYGEMKLDLLNFPLFIQNPSPRLEGEIKQVFSLVKMDSGCPRGNLRHTWKQKPCSRGWPWGPQENVLGNTFLFLKMYLFSHNFICMHIRRFDHISPLSSTLHQILSSSYNFINL